MCRLSGEFDHVSVYETAIGTGAGYHPYVFSPSNEHEAGWLIPLIHVFR